MITIPSLSDVTDILDTDQVMVTNSQGQSYKIAGSEINKRGKIIIANSTTITGAPLKAGVPVRVYFTEDLTAANASTPLQLNYNGVNYYVKAPKDGTLINFVATNLGGSPAVYKYLQKYTTLELLFDGTQFVIIGNPVVLSSADYTIYADGYLKSSTLDNTSNIPTKSLIYNLFFDNSPEILSDLRLNNRGIMLNTNRNKIPIIRLIDSETLNRPDDSITQGALIIIATKNQGLNAHVLVTLDNYTSADAYKVRMYIRSAWWNGSSVSYTNWKTVVN